MTVARDREDCRDVTRGQIWVERAKRQRTNDLDIEDDLEDGNDIEGIQGEDPVSESLVEKIRQLVADQLGVAPEVVTSDANILEDLGADSLDVVELVMEIEETFDIEISDDEAQAMHTMGDVERFVIGSVAA